MKRILSVILFVFIILTLSACGGFGGKQEEPDAVDPPVVQNNTYTLSFEVNGGEAIADQTIAKNGVLQELPEPTREGYAFLGWYTDETLRLDAKVNVKITADTKFYASWAKLYKITYEENGGEELEDPVYPKYAHLSLPTRAGYLFAGWYDNPELSGKPLSRTFEISEDRTVYADWTTSNVLGHEGYTVEDGVYTRTEKLPNSTESLDLADCFELDRYAELKFYSKAVYETNYTPLESTVVPLNVEGENIYYFMVVVNAPIGTTEKRTYYSDYKKIKFYKNHNYSYQFFNLRTVTSYGNAEEGSKLEPPEEPVLDNYQFEGWFTDRLGTQKWSFTENAVTNNLKLYSVWKPENGTVSEGLTFTEPDDYIGYNKLSGLGSFSGTELVIPEVYKGYQVTGICADSLALGEDIIKITVPPSIGTIELGCFRGADNVAEMVLCGVGYGFPYNFTLGEFFGEAESGTNQGGKIYAIPNTLKKITLTSGINCPLTPLQAVPS